MMMMTMKQEESSPPPRKMMAGRTNFWLFRNNNDNNKTKRSTVAVEPVVLGCSLSLGKGFLLDDGIVQLTTSTPAPTNNTTPSCPSNKNDYCLGVSTIVTCNDNNKSPSNYSDIESLSLDTNTSNSTRSVCSSSHDHHGGAWSEESVEATCRLWTLNDTERKVLIELGRRVDDIKYYKNTPDEIIRFLNAKGMDIDAAEKMFRTSVEWRRSVRADAALRRTPPPGLLDAIPGAIMAGADRDGDPVFVSRVGTLDAIGAYKAYGRDEIVHHCVWIRELAGRGEWRRRREEAMGRPMKQLLIIEDMKGIQLSKLVGCPAVMSLYGEMMRIDQENYPDASKRIIVIRTPALFRMVWNLVKPFFDKYVVDKMIFCGHHDCEAVLARYVDLSILPHDLLPGIGQGQAEIGMPQRFDGGGGGVTSSSSRCATATETATTAAAVGSRR